MLYTFISYSQFAFWVTFLCRRSETPTVEQTQAFVNLCERFIHQKPLEVIGKISVSQLDESMLCIHSSKSSKTCIKFVISFVNFHTRHEFINQLRV